VESKVPNSGVKGTK